MKVEKSARRIEITLRYGDPLQPKIKARGYKWEPTKKVWWKGYTDEENERRLDAGEKAVEILKNQA